MTTPTKSTAAKATANKAADNVVVDDVVDTPKSRIPDALSGESILKDFCQRYLDIFDEIAKYNAEVLAEKDSEWNAGKVLEAARNKARPTDKNVKPNDEIKKALETWEDLINKTALARKALLDVTSKDLGITLSATADRNPEIEAPLKEKRKIAAEIGSQLSNIAKLTANEGAGEAVIEFLMNNPLPAIGRDQARSFGNDGGKATPKYRVNVVITKDGNELHNDAGFTKAALALTKPVFGYERGMAPKSDTLREAWEKAGNSSEKTVIDPVEFDDNGLHFKISKK